MRPETSFCFATSASESPSAAYSLRRRRMTNPESTGVGRVSLAGPSSTTPAPSHLLVLRDRTAHRPAGRSLTTGAKRTGERRVCRRERGGQRLCHGCVVLATRRARAGRESVLAAHVSFCYAHIPRGECPLRRELQHARTPSPSRGRVCPRSDRGPCPPSPASDGPTPLGRLSALAVTKIDDPTASRMGFPYRTHAGRGIVASM